MASTGSGPYVQTAVFVDRFIRGAQSGALSLINILDNASVAGPENEDMPPFSLAGITLVIGLWAGQTKGRYGILLRPEQPSGLQGEPIKLGQVTFADTGARGVDLITQIPYEVTEEGVYWFDVLFEPGGGEQARLLSRIPLTVTYQPQPVG